MVGAFFKYHSKQFFRKIYWLYRLSKIKFGKSKQLSFPIKVEGRGKLIFGNYAKIQSYVNLGIANDSYLNIGNYCHLEDYAKILVSAKNELIIGDNFKLGNKARLFVHGQWKIGDDVKIETNCSIFSREPNGIGNLEIGNGSRIGDFTLIDLVHNVTIGNDVAIGPNCTLYTHDHKYDDLNVPAWKGGLVSQPIIIEDGAWVGSGVTILPGVTIGKRSVVAAGSIVTKSIESNSIYGGVPAKKIKDINKAVL